MTKNTTGYATALTIGCRLNQTDTALIFGSLQEAGFQIVKPDTTEPLSLIIINTCSVTASASQKSRQAAKSFRKKHPDAHIIVTGCDIETDSDSWKKEGAINQIIPNSDKTNILNYLKDVFDLYSDSSETEAETAVPDISFTEKSTGYYPFKSRANIKIQNGCDSFCTYCIVPYGRGKPQSRKWKNTIDEFKQLVNSGHKEIILTGVNIATYNDSGRNLVDLLKKLITLKGDFRIRLSSTEPQFNMHGLIDIIASTDKICRFLHLPLQYGENSILKRMGRQYTREDFADFVLKATAKIPDICIGTDIIAGFPGETDEIFEECKEFVSKLPFAYLHVFKYSRRAGTPAASYKNQVPAIDASRRHKILTDIGNSSALNFIKQQEGKAVNVLFENYSVENNELRGWSDNYIKIYTPPPYNTDIKYIETSFIGSILPVNIDRATAPRKAEGRILTNLE